MASHPRRDNNPSMFTSKTPHFFKVILQETVQDGILGIPTKFVRKYGNQLSSFVKLEVPSGVIWQVELTKSNGRVQLQKGWREFADHYSLELGSLVVFRYEGNGYFHVLIFDKTASEIEYPYSSNEDDDFCDEVPASRKSKEKRELSCPPPQMKIITDSPNQPGRKSKYGVLSSDIRPDDNKPSRINLGNLKKVETSLGKLDARRSVKTEAFTCVQMLTAAEKTRALQIVSAFKSTGNPVFMLVLQPSFVCQKYRMGIPWDFARKYLPKHNCGLTLLNSAGKTWHANLYCNAKIPLAQIYGGWRAFVEYNHLTAGDICVFELMKHPEILMKVHIYPVVENASKAPHLSRKGKKKSHFPCPLPRKKMRTDSPNTSGTNSKLEVSYSHISPGDSKSSRINLGNLKQVEKIPQQLDAQRSVKTEALSCVQRLTDTKKVHAVQIANAFESTGNPFFMVVMQPSFVCYHYRMGIPWDFAMKYLPKHNCDLTLLDSAGKTWPVKYYCSAENKKPCAQLYGGWQAFAEDSHLYARDICVFELIKRHPEILMKVVINPVVENASKVSRPQNHVSIASGVKTRSLVNDTEPNCQRSPCPSSSIKMEDSSVSYTEILDDFPLNQKAKKKLTSSSFQPCKVMGTNPSGGIQAKGMKLEKEKKSMNFQFLTEEVGGDRSVKPGVLSCSQKLTDNEKAWAIQRASAFKSTENPVFMVVMQPSFVRNMHSLCIPSAFSRKFLPMHNCDLTLQNSAGKTWPVNYYYYHAGNRRARLFGGWKEFVEDNHLDVGDICVFELIKHPEILMKVVIYPIYKNITKVCSTPAHGTISSRVTTRSFVSDTEPNCQQSSCPSSYRKREDPADSYIEILDDSPLNQIAKKILTSSSIQPCKVMRTNPTGSIEAKGSKLEKEKKSMDSQYLTKDLGDELKYSPKDDSARISIGRRCLKPELTGKIKTEPFTPNEKQIACTSNPSFSFVIQPSSVLPCTSLNIPKEFAKRCMQKYGEMILRVPDGRTWTVDYDEGIASSEPRSVSFGCNSWRKFAVDNELKVGDVCIFELINENVNLLEVVIQRKLLLIEID